MMQWKELLTTHRLCKEPAAAASRMRSPFQVDYDRIVFSSAFRRMQDKTQVFPLAESDYVRTRLTHSLETSCIGRSLGERIGAEICKRWKLTEYHASDIGAIVSAACLAHDIGNPPFGHSGEDAIRHWFQSSEVAREIGKQLTDDERKDIEYYDGNAEGFRILTVLQMPNNMGGMQLTSATLGAFVKYPVESRCKSNDGDAGKKKFGFFQSEKELFMKVAGHAGLIRSSKPEYSWRRHPLAFVVEAADDITYTIVDFEDGYRLGLVSFEEIEERFRAIIGGGMDFDKLNSISDKKNKMEYLRSKAFGKLIDEITECFLANERSLLDGTLRVDLVSMIPSGNGIKEIKKRSRDDVYSAPRVIEIEAAGFEVASGLLDIFVRSANDRAERGEKGMSNHSRKMLQLLPKQFIEREPLWMTSPYCRLLSILDFFAGMTDSYAVNLFKKIKGISLPEK